MNAGVRGALIAAGAVLVIASLSARDACAVPPPDSRTVTARPPLEAVPVTPAARTQQVKLRRCTAAAQAKRLHGKPRAAFVRSCMMPKHPASASASRRPGR